MTDPQTGSPYDDDDESPLEEAAVDRHDDAERMSQVGITMAAVTDDEEAAFIAGDPVGTPDTAETFDEGG